MTTAKTTYFFLVLLGHISHLFDFITKLLTSASLRPHQYLKEADKGYAWDKNGRLGVTYLACQSRVNIFFFNILSRPVPFVQLFPIAMTHNISMFESKFLYSWGKSGTRCKSVYTRTWSWRLESDERERRREKLWEIIVWSKTSCQLRMRREGWMKDQIISCPEQPWECDTAWHGGEEDWHVLSIGYTVSY